MSLEEEDFKKLLRKLMEILLGLVKTSYYDDKLQEIFMIMMNIW